jgi:hypothetical protein
MDTSTSVSQFANIFSEEFDVHSQSTKSTGDQHDVPDDVLDFMPMHLADQLVINAPSHHGVVLTPDFVQKYNESTSEAQENIKFLVLAQLPRERAADVVRDHAMMIKHQTEYSAQETERLKAQEAVNKSKLAESETDVLEAKSKVLELEIKLETLKRTCPISEMSSQQPHPKVQKTSRVPKPPKKSLAGLRITKFFTWKPTGRGFPALYLSFDHGGEVKSWNIKDFDEVYGISAVPIADIIALKSEDFTADDSCKLHKSAEKWLCVKKALCG